MDRMVLKLRNILINSLRPLLYCKVPTSVTIFYFLYNVFLKSRVWPKNALAKFCRRKPTSRSCLSNIPHLFPFGSYFSRSLNLQLRIFWIQILLELRENLTNSHKLSPPSPVQQDTYLRHNILIMSVRYCLYN